jgi:hypothetical protein
MGRHIALAAAVALSVAMARAADDLPKAETILDRYLEVTGGKAAYQKIHSEIQKGTIDIAAMGIKGTMTSYRAEPDKSYQEVELPGLGKNLNGSDGKVFWSIIPMMGPHVKEGPEKAEAVMSAKFNAELNWRDIFKEAKTTGVDNVGGKECYKVLLTPAEGNAVTQCYDKQSGLMVKVTMNPESPAGPVTVESFATDYHKEGEILMPHKIEQRAAGQSFVINIDSISFNVEIPADKFDLPAEIKALVNKK